MFELYEVRDLARKQIAMNILVLTDSNIDPADLEITSVQQVDNKPMEFYVIRTLCSLGHQVSVLQFGPNIQATLEKLTATDLDLVFNLTEEVGGDRRKDMHVATLLELLKIPYTGAGPMGLILGRDKALSKTIVNSHNVKVPAFATLPCRPNTISRRINFPIIVKPRMGDGSDGITLKSLIHNEPQLAKQLKTLRLSVGQEVICEEYIEGRELRVFIIGNQKLHAFPVLEVKFGKSGGPQFQTSRVKTDKNYRTKWKITHPCANLTSALETQVVEISKSIYRLLALRDYGRIDLRLNNSSEVYFLEANPNPSIYPEVINNTLAWFDWDYTSFIGQIVKLALRRVRRDSVVLPSQVHGKELVSVATA